MKRWEIIQYLIDENNYTSYLEIGVGKGVNYDKIKCAKKEGVDPKARKCNCIMTSDGFFAKAGRKKWDIIFIDGLHEEAQVDKDILNSLRHLKRNGVIVMHDCNPPTWKHQAVPRLQKVWNGNTWKSFVKLRVTAPHLFMYTVESDWGCGIIKKGKQEVYDKASLKECLRYKYFDKHRYELLKLVQPGEFKAIL